jgi:hypothetical protein
MPTLNVGGRRVKVDDSFLSLTPEQQNETVDEIAQSLGAPQQEPQSPEMQLGMAEMSAMTQNPARAQYDALPAWQKPLVAASDVGLLTAQGAASMVGLNPEKGAAWLRSSLGTGSYNDELAEQRRMTSAARKRAGGAGTAAEITGSVAGPVGLARRGLTLAGRGGTAAMKGVPGLVTRSAMMGAEGAGYGAANAFANDQNIAEGGLYGLLGGAAGNVVGEGISAGIGKVAGMFNKAPPKIGADDLNASKEAAYAASEKAGVIIKPAGIQRLKDKVEADLADFGYDEDLHAGAKTALKRINALLGQNVTLKGLDTVRKVASNGYNPLNKSNNKAISKIIGHIDELIDSNNPQFMAGINTRDGIKSLLEARKFAHRARKLETVEKLAAKGARIGGRQKNQDVAGATRRQLHTVLDNEAKGRGFTGAEKKALEKAAGFTVGQRALDTVGGLMPQGKLGAMIQGATALGTGGSSIPFQMAGMAAGYGAHKASEALASKSVREFVDLVARGGVPAPVVQNALQRLSASKRDAISRALMALSVNQSSRAQQPAQ